ncbi:MAG: DUF512 domain-containing protein [Clostridia bacterium]|nr:DUF512 domain-containing protein [Clostridia bacterium]
MAYTAPDFFKTKRGVILVTVDGVEAGSLADKAGITDGDILISVNGHDISDVLDYRFYIASRKVTLKIHRGPELFDITVKKGEYDDIGLEFKNELMDECQTCRNKCIFCFIDQMPKGMRESLYLKDDDSRMSFLTGSYITLTNLSERDIERVIEMKLSPINVSVHTTNPELRKMMMQNRFAGESLKTLKKFAKAGIELHCQIVVCRGINDGEELERTMSDLCELYPAVQSVSVVPCGLTKFREGLYPLEPFTQEDCRDIIERVDRVRAKSKREHGKAVFCCADELYLKARLPLPDEDYYEGYPQFENGVGMITSMRAEVKEELEHLFEDFDVKAVNKKMSIATGEAAYGIISESVKAVCEKVPGLECRVYKIVNDYFGESITVAGLITGTDLIKQLKGKELGDVLLLPSVMLRYEKDLFLDGVSIDEVEEALGVEIRLNENSGYSLIDALLE